MYFNISLDMYIYLKFNNIRFLFKTAIFMLSSEFDYQYKNENCREKN